MSDEEQYSRGSVVWALQEGYPPWPAVVTSVAEDKPTRWRVWKKECVVDHDHAGTTAPSWPGTMLGLSLITALSQGDQNIIFWEYVPDMLTHVDTFTCE